MGFVQDEMILHVDLTSGKVWFEDLTDKLRMQYLGAVGINARLLFDHVDETIDPYSPENVLILGVGPLVGQPFPSACRTVGTAKGPLTNAYAHSGAMGKFGVKLKAAGIPHLVIHGKASQPVYIEIKDKNVTIKCARYLWGKNVPETFKALHDQYEDCEVACIGPAGENLVRYSCIVLSHNRFMGRSGMGGVMGSKNLKAITIQTSQTINVLDRKKMVDYRSTYQKLFKKQMLSAGLGFFGTTLVVGTRVHEGTLAVRNFRDKIPREISRLTEDNFLKYKTRKKGCWGCSIGCHHYWKVNEGRFAGTEGDKVEGGNIGALGVNLALFDYPAVLSLVKMINVLGIDSHELGLTISWAMECWEHGLITKETTDGLPLEWGNYDVIAELINRITYRKGAIGDLLADGAKRAADTIGKDSEKYSWHVKGQSFPIWIKNGDTLGFCVAARGSDHLFAYPFSSQGYDKKNRIAKRLFGAIGNKVGDPYIPDGKGRSIWWHENLKAIIDSIGICLFPTVAAGISKDYEYILPATFGKILSDATGYPWDGIKVMECAERIIQTEKAFNAKCGLSRKDDYFVKKPEGRHYRPQTKVNLDHPGMLDEYYQYRGFSRDGFPTCSRLEEVGLEDIAEELLKKEKIRDEKVPSLKSIMIEQDVY